MSKVGEYATNLLYYSRQSKMKSNFGETQETRKIFLFSNFDNSPSENSFFKNNTKFKGENEEFLWRII